VVLFNHEPLWQKSLSGCPELRVLIVDPEYLVALDGEHVLSDALGCNVEIAMPRDYPAILENHRFDVVLIDVRVIQDNVADAARLIGAAGARVVLSSLSHVNANGFAQWPDVPVVLKPFDDSTLIEAVKNAATSDRDVSSSPT
jgi:DNA-binding NarL/FixJ family response regulator